MISFKAISRYCLLCYLLALANNAISVDNIDLLISNNPQSALVAKSLKKNLLQYKSDLNFNDISVEKFHNYQPKDSIGLTISVGTKATQELFNSNPAIPIYSLMIPHTAYQSMLKRMNNKTPFSALYLDQPLERYFATMKRFMPATKTVGMVSMGELAADVLERQSIAKTFGLELINQQIKNSSNPIAEINQLLTQVDCILLLPENAGNQLLIKWILFSAYKYKKPVFGFSAQLLEAGAIASLHSDLDSLANEAADELIEFFQSGEFKRQPRFADSYQIKINSSIADSLDMPLSDMQ